MLQLVNVVDHRIDAQKFAAALPPKIPSSPKLYPQDCFNLDRRSCVHCLRSRYRCEGQAQILFVLASLLRSLTPRVPERFSRAAHLTASQALKLTQEGGERSGAQFISSRAAVQRRAASCLAWARVSRPILILSAATAVSLVTNRHTVWS